MSVELLQEPLQQHRVCIHSRHGLPVILAQVNSCAYITAGIVFGIGLGEFVYSSLLCQQLDHYARFSSLCHNIGGHIQLDA